MYLGPIHPTLQQEGQPRKPAPYRHLAVICESTLLGMQLGAMVEGVGHRMGGCSRKCWGGGKVGLGMV